MNQEENKTNQEENKTNQEKNEDLEKGLLTTLSNLGLTVDE